MSDDGSVPLRAATFLAEFLSLLNRDFYNNDCLRLLYAHNYAYDMPIVKWGKTIQDELDSG